jgi:hypothetical protein
VLTFFFPQAVKAVWKRSPMKKHHLHFRPLNLFFGGGTVKMLSPFSRLLTPHQQLACNSCSMCATKGGRRTIPTICGVLSLDPSPYSPLELVKSVDDVPGSWQVYGGGIQQIDSEEPWQLTAAVNSES